MPPNTRIFRDRLVSMEQTLEGGEKHLPALEQLCREALPEFEPEGHSLDHERDLFVMDLKAADGRRKRVGWTRMMLFDAERIPVLSEEPRAGLRGKIVEFLRARASRPEIVVTFRHLEEGWMDTPEPRREKRRRRGGGRLERAAGATGRAEKRGGPRPPQARPSADAASSASPPLPEAAPTGGVAPRPPGPGRRRRFRRRRRGRGSGPGAPPGGAPA